MSDDRLRGAESTLPQPPESKPAMVTGRVGRLGGRLVWLQRRPALAAALILGALSLLFVSPALVPGHTLSASDYLWSATPWSATRPADVKPLGSNPELVDSAVVYQPFLQFNRRVLPSLPLWNPYISGGRPYLGGGESLLLSPFSLPVYVLPFWWALGVAAALKLFAAAFGTYLLARSVGMRFGGALLAGLAYGLSLTMVAWLTWTLADVWALLPWLLLLTELIVRRPAPPPAAGLATVVALQFFGGHPESSFHVLAATVAWFALRIAVIRRQKWAAPTRFSALLLVGALAAGAGLAALVVVPFVEFLGHSNDVQVRSHFSAVILPHRYLLSLMLPDYWGRWTQTPLGPFLRDRDLYIGALPLILVAVALVSRPTLERTGVAAIGLVSLAIIFGVAPSVQIASHIPLVKVVNNVPLTFLFAMCAALLAGWGLDELSQSPIALAGRRALLVLIGGMVLIPLGILIHGGALSLSQLFSALNVAWGFARPGGNLLQHSTIAVVRMAALIVWLSMVGLALALLTARWRGRLSVHAFVTLAVGLVAVDLFRAGMGQNPSIRTTRATQPATPAIRFLQVQRPNRFVGLDAPPGPSPLVPDLSIRWGLYDARGYDFPIERRYDALWTRAVNDTPPPYGPAQNATLTPESLLAFNLLSVTDIVQHPDAAAVRNRALSIVYDRPDARIYRNPGALPRVGLVGAQEVVRSDAAQLGAVLTPGFDGRRTVVTGKPLPGLPTAGDARAPGVARVVSYARDRVILAAEAQRTSELVLTDVFYPGWKATLDGTPIPIDRVDYLLRGITLPPGRHTVRFRYQPDSWRVGWIVSLATLLGVLATVALGWRGRRKRLATPKDCASGGPNRLTREALR